MQLGEHLPFVLCPTAQICPFPDDLSNRKTRVFDLIKNETRYAHVSLINIFGLLQSNLLLIWFDND